MIDVHVVGRIIIQTNVLLNKEQEYPAPYFLHILISLFADLF